MPRVYHLVEALRSGRSRRLALLYRRTSASSLARRWLPGQARRAGKVARWCTPAWVSGRAAVETLVIAEPSDSRVGLYSQETAYRRRLPRAVDTRGDPHSATA